MLLRSIIGSMATLCFVSSCAALNLAADTRIPGFKSARFRLQSMTKSHHNNVMDGTASERASFCGENIQPVLKRRNDLLVLELDGAQKGFEWRAVQSIEPAGTLCRSSERQTISQSGNSSTLALYRWTDCTAFPPTKATLILNGDEITYKVEPVKLNSSRAWEIDPSRESYTCVWSALP